MTDRNAAKPSFATKQRTRSPTLREVARRARVSVMTVSNVVNGRHELMTAETRKRVESAISAVNYRRHESGRSLRLSQRFAIAMLIVDPSPAFLADPFITNVVAGLGNFLGERGYSLVLQGCSAERLDQALAIRNNGTDAHCLMLSGAPAVRRRCLDLVARSAQPLLVFQEAASDVGDDVCSIRQDDHGGAAQLTRHLIERGARDLAVLFPELPWPALEERERGVRSAIGPLGDQVNLVVISCGTGDYTDTQAALAQHADRAGLPDAILAGNDQIGIAALKWLRAFGKRVPKDIRITGFNAFEFWQFSDPILTTVRSPAYEMGKIGGAELLERLESGKFRQHEIVLPVTFQIGEST
jgi:LacI family transcriptional regulator